MESQPAGHRPRGAEAPTVIRTAVNPRLDVADSVPLDDEGYVRTWLILSPVNYAPLVTAWGELGRQQIPREAALRPRAGDKATVAGTDLTWTAFSGKDASLDLAAATAAKTSHNMLGYAVSYVHTPVARSKVKLKTGSSDQGKFYLNGKPAIAFDAYRAIRADQDVATVALKKGPNVIVMKVLNGEGRWGGCVRFTDMDDRPLPDLTVTTDPSAR